ncbi:hypothetical protein K3495_g9422 [Podosphaera aphanis]|nr:hypothetical protein K3495_g9422 [Podosphaera aphanis]
MPMYRDQTEPAWSNGWPQRFQQLYGIHKTRRYGEASSALASHDEEIRTIQQALTDFPLREIYDRDETGLFYKSVPEVSPTTCHLSGHKANKDRVTTMHTVLASGQVLKIWYIGTSKQPRCFKNVKIESFNFVYRNNKKAWMNTEIMIEYLKWFDKEMAGRNVVLLMDNFSAHKAAFEFVNSSPLISLKSTSVIFLPPNVTSLHQPLDKAIIHAWKCHYRKKWPNHMIETFEKGDDPSKEMDVLTAMRWGSVSWHFHVTKSSMQKCWIKSGLLKASLATSCTEAELVSLAERVALQRGIQNISSINDFVTPNSEEVFDDINTSEELYLEETAELFDSEILIENDEEYFEELGSGADSNKVDLDEAIAATKLLLKWQEQSGDGDGAKHLAYTRDLRQLQNRQENSRKQTTITSFFSVDKG